MKLTPPWAGRSVGRWYSDLATHLCNVLIFLVLLNAVLLPVYAITDERARYQVPPWYTELRQRVGPAWASLVYPGWDESAVLSLYAEWFRLVYAYDPVTQYTVQPAQGAYYNVSADGFRLNGPHAPWPPDGSAFNVIMFGGSTTFGSGLPDHQTIPAVLETLLNEQPCATPVRVYNFGVPGHASFEERARFEQLLLSDAMPHVAVFVDGLNDALGGPSNHRYTRDLARMMAMVNTKDVVTGFGARAREFVASLPMTRLAQSARAALGRLRRGDSPPTPYVLSADVESEERLVQWLANKRVVEAVGQQFGVRTLFVWQPAPIYNYDLDTHLLDGQVPAWMQWVPAFQGKTTLYQRLDERRQDPAVAQNFLWLADMQLTRPENLYVDLVHYTAAFTRDVASAIADDLSRRGWSPCDDRGDRRASTAGRIA